MAIVGYVTTTDAVICLHCNNMGNLHAFGVGTADAPIMDPAPRGIYEPSTNSDRYDAACAVCGWPVRRTTREGETI